MTKGVKLFCAASLVIGLLSPQSFALTSREVGKKLICQCGCNTMVLSECGCAEAYKELADVDTMIKAGKSQNEIVAVYVKRYGTKALSAPPAKGFNLAAWWLPFLTALAGFAVLAYALRRMIRRPLGSGQTGDGISPPQAPAEGAESEAARREVENDLKRMDF